MKNRFNKITTLVTSLLVAIFCLGIIAAPDKAFSSAENRTLMQKPKFTSKNFLSGKYTADLGKYLADQFPLREAFVSSKAYFELLQGKRENNGIIHVSKNLLVARPEEADRLEENLRSIKVFADNVNTEVLVAALPRSIDVFEEYLPEFYPKEETKDLWEDYNALTKKLNLKTVDLYDTLCESNAYYSTDHHYTSNGAYLTYLQLKEGLNFTPKNQDFFDVQKVADDFCGTSMRKSGFYLADKDTIELYRYKGDLDYSVIADGEEISLYDMGKLDTIDKYSVFLGGNHSRVDITLQGEERPKLLMVRDSFADSLVPFLALHYDITLIDLRYFNDSVASLTKNEDYDKVLVFLNVSELSTRNNLSYLEMP